jgi:hypothetical protein
MRHRLKRSHGRFIQICTAIDEFRQQSIGHILCGI